MTAGAPDFERRTRSNIITQDLARLVHRPSYGGAQRSYLQVNAVANNVKDLINVSGKGIIYGGVGASDGTATQKADYFGLFIDGQWFSTMTFESLAYYGLDYRSQLGIHALDYDDTGFLYSIAIQPGITFDSSFYLGYIETHGRTPLLTAQINYALV